MAAILNFRIFAKNGKTQNFLLQTRNLEPQYSDSIMESLSSHEYDAPYDHMFHQSDLNENTKQFGFLPNPF